MVLSVRSSSSSTVGGIYALVSFIFFVLNGPSPGGGGGGYGTGTKSTYALYLPHPVIGI